MSDTITQALRFIAAQPEDAVALGQAGTWAVTLDDSAEITFPDGSVASCLNGGPWQPMTLAEAGEDMAEADQDELADYYDAMRAGGAQIDLRASDRAPRGWTHIEGGLEG